MTSSRIYREVIMPTIVPLGIILVTAILVFGIGEALIGMYKPGTAELRRVELWAATLAAVAILAVAGFLATRPQGSLGALDREIAFGGDRPMLAPPLPPVSVTLRRGVVGTSGDLRPGFILYARNGALATVVEVLSSVTEPSGQMRKGMVYAKGIRGGESELWIPSEAVSTVYPETRSGFLAISGDEAAALGWNRPPAAFSRNPPKEEQKLY